MTRRSVDWNEGLARDLKRAQFAREFIRASLDDGLTLQEVLGKAIRAYGVQEFATKVRMPASNILRVLRPGYNPTLVTMSRLLKPFNLKITIEPTERRKVA